MKHPWAGPALVVLLAATAPLLAPFGFGAAAWAPDVAVLAVVALALRGTPDRAALLGVLIGFLASPWTVEPLCFRPLVLGSIGWLTAQGASLIHREQPFVAAGAAALGVLALRGAETVAAAFATRGGAPWTPGDAGGRIGATLLAAAVTAAAMPLWLGAVARWRLLAPLERSFRDV